MNERKPGIQSAIGSVNYGGQPRKVLTVDDAMDDAPIKRSFSSGSFDDEPMDRSNQNRSNQNGPIEDLISEEELAELAQNREQLQQARKASVQLKNKIPEGIKRRLEILTGIGRLMEDVEVDGVTFSLRSLKPYESEDVIKSIVGFDYQALQAFELRAQTLARSLYGIDGQKIELVIDDDTLDGKVNFIKNVLEESLVNYLWAKYQEILDKNKKKFNDMGKTEEEVIENVKKS